jgi:hypothetical protein
MLNLAGSGATPASAGFEPPSSWGLAPRRTSGLPRLVRDPRRACDVGQLRLKMLMSPKVRFAADSPVEGEGFEPSVPRLR